MKEGIHQNINYLSLTNIYLFYLNIKGIPREAVFSLLPLCFYSRCRYVTGSALLRKLRSQRTASQDLNPSQR